MGRIFDSLPIRKKKLAISENLAETQIHFYFWEGREKRLKVFRDECEKMENIAEWKTYTIIPKFYWSHNVVELYNWKVEDIKAWIEPNIHQFKLITLKKLLSK